MIYKELKQILYNDEYEDLFELIFRVDLFSFPETSVIDDLDNYDNREEGIADAQQFGCTIKGSEIILPVGLPFRIIKADPRSPTLFSIKHNNVEYDIDMLDDYDDINVEFTDFGSKLSKYAEENFKSLIEAYEDIKSIEKIFKINIIK